MKKLLIGMLLMISALTAYGQCDWSSWKLSQTNQYKNEYQFGLEPGYHDSCANWRFTIRNFTRNTLDTVGDYLGYLDIHLKYKGFYRVYVEVWSICKKCDTAKFMVQVYVLEDDTIALGTKDLVSTYHKPKLIGTYDMLGRPVEKVENDIPYIFLYNNGQRKKVIKRN